MSGSRKKGQLAIFQFYQVIISPGETHRRALENLISGLSEAGKKKMRNLPKNVRLRLAFQAAETEAVDAVSRKLTAVIKKRALQYVINFEPQLLLMYFTELILTLGLEEGSLEVHSEAETVLLDIFRALGRSIRKYNPKAGLSLIGQLGFFRRKRQEYQRKKTINSLFLALDSRLQEAMGLVDIQVYNTPRPTLPKDALESIQKRAISDAFAILQTLPKLDRIFKIKAILQRIVSPLAKKILSSFETKETITLAQLMNIQSDVSLARDVLKNVVSPARRRIESSAPPKKILLLTYDPKTQRGLVLRLRARLGQHFELRFKSIGVNGNGKGKEKEEGKKPFPILSLPAELVNFITMFLIKINPTSEESKTLFSFARSDPAFREFLEHPGLERMTSQNVLGVSHSRTREERRLGLEPNVKKRYRHVLWKLSLFNAKDIKSLQDIADRNAEKYKEGGAKAYLPFITSQRPKKKVEGEEEEQEKKRIKITPRISSWPWWYFRLLSNHRSLVSMTNPVSMTTHVSVDSDLFSASIVTVNALEPVRERIRPPRHFNLRTFTDVRPKSFVSGPEGGDILLRFGRHQLAKRWRDLHSQLPAGADLMVIPMDKLITRAGLFGFGMNRHMKLEGSIQLIISVAQPIPLEIPREGRASFRKEVIMTGLEKMTKIIELHRQEEIEVKRYNVELTLQIQHAYLGNGLTQFLGHQRGARPYLRLKTLNLQHVHFENHLAPLDLSGITGDQLAGLRFGPTNLSHVPKLSCPSPHLTKLRLVTPNTRNSILLWDLPEDPAPCFPKLDQLHIKGNVRIWKSPLVEKIGKFPLLTEIYLETFPGHDEDLLRLAANLQGDKRRYVAVDLKYYSGVLETGVFGNVNFQHLNWPPEM